MLLLALASSTPEPPPPDVLLVVMDTVRADHLATYGYERDTSYQLNQVAAAGVVFEQARVASSWTWPGHAELFTGEPPWVSGAHYIDSTDEVPVQAMRTDLPTLAEAFRDAGYRTESHATNWLLDPELGLTRGFEHAVRHESDTLTVKAVQDALARDDERPLFLFVNLTSAHAPYLLRDGVPWSDAHAEAVRGATEGTLSKMRIERGDLVGLEPGLDCGEMRCDLSWTAGSWQITPEELQAIHDLYDSNLVGLDNALRAVVAAWTANRSGVVAITSDHGELLGEHRMLQHRLITVPELLHVPLVLVGPGIQGGTRSDTKVHIGDLVPTLKTMAGIESEGWTLLDGLAGTPRPGRIEAAAWPDPRIEGLDLVSKPWGYVEDGDRAVAVSGDRVLQLGSEPADEEMIEAARALPARSEKAPLLGDEARKQLEAMGYM